MGCGLVFLLIVMKPFALAVLLAGSLVYLVFAGVYPHSRRHDNDFRHIYLGVQALANGDSPYPPQTLLLYAHRAGLGDASLNPFVYLPFTGLSLAFLAPLPFRAASEVWFVLNHLLTIAGAWLLAMALTPKAQPKSEIWPRLAIFGGIVSVLGLCHPYIRSLTAGQLNSVLFFCYAAAFVALLRGRERLAGGILGFAALFKLAPAAFLLFFALRRKWQGLGAMAATCALLLGISVLVFGWRVHAEFLPMLEQMSYGHSTWQQYGATFWKDPWNQSANSLLSHLLVARNGVTTPWFHSAQSTANAWTYVFSLSVLAAYLVCFRPGGARLAPGESAALPLDDQMAFHAAILLSLLAPSLLWDHYLVQAIIPCLWLIGALAGQRRFITLALAALVLVLICIPWPFATPSFSAGWRVLLMSLKLYPTVLLFALICANSKTGATGTPPPRTGNIQA